MQKSILEIDAGSNSFSFREEELKDVIGVVDYGVAEHNKDKSYNFSPLDPHNSLIFGIGPLAGSIIPGTHRLVFIARSPVVETMFLSTVGGAGLPLYHAGVDLVKVCGKSKAPLILIIKNMGKGLSVEFVPIEYEDLIKIYKKRNNRGLYNLQEYVLGSYRDKFRTENGYADFRILVVGPAAIHTTMGAICSTVVRNGEFVRGVDGWAGRGGFGSVLAQAHNVVAIIYGGNSDSKVFPKLNLKDRAKVDNLFMEKFKKNTAVAAKDATEKYRYIEKKNTGGTFGVNMTDLGSWLPMFNWTSIYMTKEKREEMYEKFVKNNYLMQFNKEIIDTKLWKTCGEPCPAVCKKVLLDRKKDYEAYEAFGPNCGIFDQRHAELIAEAIEGMGYDAICFGNIASMILESLSKKLLSAQDIGIDAVANFNPNTFTLKDSENHAKIGAKIALDIAYQSTEFGKLFKNGLRHGIINLSGRFRHNEKSRKTSFRDIANYIPFGKGGYIAPVQYWVPGFYIPLPIQGKFFTYYGQDFYPPKQLGHIAAERAIKELYSENTGICRFHRGWSEDIAGNLINEAYGLNIDYYAHCRRLLQEMRNYDKKAGVVPAYWETQRVKDIVMSYIREVVSVFGGNSEAKMWLERYSKNPEEASREYWKQLLLGVNELIDWKSEEIN